MRTISVTEASLIQANNLALLEALAWEELETEPIWNPAQFDRPHREEVDWATLYGIEE